MRVRAKGIFSMSRRARLAVSVFVAVLLGSAAGATSAQGSTRSSVGGATSATWSVEASPNAAGGFSQLSNVACTSGSNCYAVGYSGDVNAQDERRILQHWN